VLFRSSEYESDSPRHLSSTLSATVSRRRALATQCNDTPAENRYTFRLLPQRSAAGRELGHQDMTSHQLVVNRRHARRISYQYLDWSNELLDVSDDVMIETLRLSAYPSVFTSRDVRCWHVAEIKGKFAEIKATKIAPFGIAQVI